MKKSALFILSALGVSALFAGTSIDVVGGVDSGSRAAIPSGDYDVVLKPNATTPSKATFTTNNNGPVINSLTTDGTPELWDVAFGMTIDVKNSSSDVIENVFVNNGKMQWRIDGVTFRNSLGSDATAKINLGDEFKLVHNNETAYKQSTWLTFSMNSNVEGKYLNALNHARTGLRVNSGSTVNWNVASSKFEKVDSGVYVSGNSTFNNNGAMNFNAGSRLDIEAGSAFNSTAALSFASGSSMDVAGNFSTTVAPNFESGSSLNITGKYNYTGTSSVAFNGNVNVSGSLTAKDLDVKLGTNGRVTFNGATTFGAGSSGDFVGALVIGKTFAVEAGSNGIALRDMDGTYKGRIMLNSGTELILGKENAFRRMVFSGENSNVNLLIMAKNTKVVLNASNKFAQLYYSGNNNSVEVVLDDSSTLFFDGASSTADSGNYLNITNFEDNRIFFVEKGNAQKILTISATTKEGKTYTLEDLEFVGGQYTDGTNGYWLNVAVPEPSTYAMIFGALALGFAIYRRRK